MSLEGRAPGMKTNPADKVSTHNSPFIVPEVVEKDVRAAGYGFRHGALSPLETFAQSISGVCPTLTPFVTVPLVFTLAGNGTWLAYLLGTVGILLVAWCIGRFA